MLLIAHRAGNALATMRAARAAGADAVEADLHMFRGRIEVRHEKTIGPIPVLWDRWRLVRPRPPRLDLPELLGALEPGTTLLLDLKGPFPRLGRLVRVMLEVNDLGTTSPIVCARNWTLLRIVRGATRTRVVASIKGPIGFALFALLRFRPDGVAMNDQIVTPARLARVRRRTPDVFVWGATTRERVLGLERLGVTGCILDDPLLGQLLAERRRGDGRPHDLFGTAATSPGESRM